MLVVLYLCAFLAFVIGKKADAPKYFFVDKPKPPLFGTYNYDPVREVLQPVSSEVSNPNETSVTKIWSQFHSRDNEATEKIIMRNVTSLTTSAYLITNRSTVTEYYINNTLTPVNYVSKTLGQSTTKTSSDQENVISTVNTNHSVELTSSKVTSINYEMISNSTLSNTELSTSSVIISDNKTTMVTSRERTADTEIPENISKPVEDWLYQMSINSTIDDLTCPTRPDNEIPTGITDSGISTATSANTEKVVKMMLRAKNTSDKPAVDDTLYKNSTVYGSGNENIRNDSNSNRDYQIFVSILMRNKIKPNPYVNNNQKFINNVTFTRGNVVRRQMIGAPLTPTIEKKSRPVKQNMLVNDVEKKHRSHVSSTFTRRVFFSRRNTVTRYFTLI